jgi:hypothetical protein
VTGRRRHWILVGAFIVLAIGSTIATGVGQMTFDNLACRSSGYGENNFLAYCRSPKYGDYEHGALYHGVEPGTVDSMRAAQALFLGNSRTQAAFSSEAMRAYFRERGVRFFVLGFGYDESSPFALALVRKWSLRPKVLVINSDPFFLDQVGQQARDAIDAKPAYLWRLVLKMLFQRVHRAVCATISCKQYQPAVFRSSEDGEWAWIPYYVDEIALPVELSQAPIPPEIIERAAAVGERFLNAVAIRRDCVVLTGTPSSEVHNAPVLARELAQRLHTKLITPTVDGLTTIDRGYLNRASAERWSGAFVELLTPVLRQCLGR